MSIKFLGRRWNVPIARELTVPLLGTVEVRLGAERQNFGLGVVSGRR